MIRSVRSLIPTSRALDPPVSRASGPRERIGDAVALALRNLPPVIGELVVDELMFHRSCRWLGMPPKLRTLIEELEAMEATRDG